MELLRAGVRWFTLPWRQWTVALAIIASTAAPIALAASANLWLTGEQDNLTGIVLDSASLSTNGIDVKLEAAFQPEQLALADAQLLGRAGAIDEMGEVTRTVYTLPGLLAIAPDGPGELVRSVGPSGRLLARAGALDNVTITEQLDDVSRGVWISTDFAAKHDLVLGDGLGFEAGALVDEQWNDIVQGGGANSVFRIVGLYEPLWSDAVSPAHQEYWAGVPPELVPRFLDAGIGANSELVLATEPTVLDSGLTGVARWTAPLSRWPTDFARLGSLEADIDRFEGQLVGSGPLAESMLALAVGTQPSPRLTSQINSTADTVRSAADRLVDPLETARSVGTIVGLLAMAAVGVFFVERNRISFRLLVAEGAGPIDIGLRVCAMLAVPVGAGAGVGLLVASPIVGFVGPDDPPGLDGVAFRLSLGVAVAALAVVASAAAVWAIRAARPSSPETARALAGALSFGVVGLAVLTWVQVGRVPSSSENTIDLTIIVLPLAVTAAGLLLALVVVGLAGRVVTRRAERLPTLGFLAVSRLAASGASIRVTSLMLGLGLGMVVFATAFVGTLGRTVDVKLSSEIGGTSRVQIIDPLPEGVRLDASTVVREFDTAITASRQRVMVLAVDRETFAQSVDWPEEFGLDAESALGLLDPAARDQDDPVDRVAAIAIDGQPIPDRSEFGFSRSFPFEVVARVRALPGSAAGRSTILVIADDLDALGLQRAGFDTLDDAAATSYRPPTDGFRRVVVSQQRLDPLLSELDRLAVRTRDPASRAGRLNAPDVVAARSAFAYLGLLGAVGAVGATGALMASLAARRRQRALSAVMLRSMGFGAGRSATATVIEVGGLVCLMALTAVVAAPFTVERVASRFDPSPSRPPNPTLDVPWVQLAVTASGALIAIAALLWCVEWRSGRRLPAEVLHEF